MTDMTSAQPDLGAMIAQRLCHDLVNPLGALGNGLELLAMTQDDTPETALMRDSLAQALGRIKLYRLAFGLASPEGRLTGPELADLLRGLGGSRKLVLATVLPSSLSRPRARLTALLALCCETALAWGGDLEIRLGDTGMRLTAAAPRLRTDQDLWDAMARTSAPDAPTPTHVHFALAAAAARALGCTLSVTITPTRLQISA